MKSKKSAFIFLFVVLGILLGGCATGMTPSSWPGISVDEELAYVANGTQIYAVRLSDGQEAWRFPEKADARKTFYAAPVLTSDDQLIIGGYDRVLYSIDLDTHNTRWEYKESKDRWIGSVLVVDDMIYAPSSDYHLYALNLQGARQWVFSDSKAPLWAQPVSDDGRIYLSSLDKNVYALDAETGDLLWTAPLDGAVLGPVLVGPDGRLFVGTFGETMVALNASNGEIIWQIPLDGWVWSTPALADGSLYFGDSSGKFYCLDADTGEEEWTLQANDSILGTPLILDDQIVFGTGLDAVYFVDRQTHEYQQKQATGQFYGSPVAAGDLILVAPVNGDVLLIAFNQQGAQVWTFMPEK